MDHIPLDEAIHLTDHRLWSEAATNPEKNLVLERFTIGHLRYPNPFASVRMEVTVALPDPRPDKDRKRYQPCKPPFLLMFLQTD